MPLTNQAPWNKHWILCCRTNSYDSLYSLARKFLYTRNQPDSFKEQLAAYRTGTLFNKSSSSSSSRICRSRTARYSLSRKSCSTSCHGRSFSRRRATLTLKLALAPTGKLGKTFSQTYWLATNEATRMKSVPVAPLSPHIRIKNCNARLWTL